MPTALAVDIGGTKIAAGLVDETGHLGAVHRAPSGGYTDPGELYGVLESLIDDVLASDDAVPAVCGVGSGGPMLPDGEVIAPLNIPAWRDGFPLRARLLERVDMPVFIDNDAKALALGEGWCGAAQGKSNFLAMVVSTGVGGGLVIDGRLLDGETGNAGHIGHVIVAPEGRKCVCGARGCLEAVASGPSVKAIHGVEPENSPSDVKRATGTYVGRAVASVANLLDLKLCAVAGSVALGFGDEFFTAAQQEIDLRARIDFAAGTRITPAGLGANAPLVGAAAVGWRGIYGDDFLFAR